MFPFSSRMSAYLSGLLFGIFLVSASTSADSGDYQLDNSDLKYYSIGLYARHGTEEVFHFPVLDLQVKAYRGDLIAVKCPGSGDFAILAQKIKFDFEPHLKDEFTSPAIFKEAAQMSCGDHSIPVIISKLYQPETPISSDSIEILSALYKAGSIRAERYTYFNYGRLDCMAYKIHPLRFNRETRFEIISKPNSFTIVDFTMKEIPANIPSPVSACKEKIQNLLEILDHQTITSLLIK
jgi:hypothetical protein